MIWNKRGQKVFSRELKHFLDICNQSEVAATLSRYKDVSIPVILKTYLKIRGGRRERGWGGGQGVGSGGGYGGGQGVGRGWGLGGGLGGGEDQNHPVHIVDWNFKHLLLTHLGCLVERSVYKH